MIRTSGSRCHFILKILMGLLVVTTGCSNRRALHDWPESHPANSNAEQADLAVPSTTLRVDRPPPKSEPAPAGHDQHKKQGAAPAGSPEKHDHKHGEEQKK